MSASERTVAMSTDRLSSRLKITAGIVVGFGTLCLVGIDRDRSPGEA